MGTPDNSSRSTGWGDGARQRLVLAVLVALTMCLAAILVSLGAGFVSGAMKALSLFAACAVVASIVVLLPRRFRATAGSFAAAFVAAAGVLPVFLSNNEAKTPTTAEEPRANAQYLADLVRQGPFTERLPTPPEGGQLGPVAIRSIQIGDPSASGRIDAVQLVVRPSSGSFVFAEIEIYPTPAAAAKRKAARIAQMVSNYGRKNVYGNCTDETGAHGAGWTCVDSRGNAYAEAAVSPSSNAHTPVASGTLAALLRYTDRLTKVAS